MLKNLKKPKTPKIKKVPVKKVINTEIEFDKIPISTKTVVITTNIDIKIDKVFETLPITKLTLPPFIKSKKHIKQFIQDHHLPNGSIVSMEYEKQTRGIPIKHFRNAMTVVFIIDSKCINFKLPTRGKIQITGCTYDIYAEQCIQHLWDYFREYSTPENQLYEFQDNATQLDVIYRTVMTNKNFHLGFKVNREQLDKYVNTTALHGRSLLETTFGYTGVNIKFRFKHRNSILKTMQWHHLHGWIHGYIDYNTYLNTLSPKEYTIELNKTRYNSFLIFHSGSAIMSGMNIEHMKEDYYAFRQMIEDCRYCIESKLIVD